MQSEDEEEVEPKRLSVDQSLDAPSAAALSPSFLEKEEENDPGPLTAKIVFVNVRDESEARIIHSHVIKLGEIPCESVQFA